MYNVDKFGSVIDNMNTELGISFINLLSVKNQLLKWLQCVIVVDGATHSHKDDAESGSSLSLSQISVLILCSA